ncbi:hypothetical protein DEA98_17435 [Brucella pseudogrignonensis]|nr:hypothetical protein [Brucella pseudogrignonensis]
MLPGDLLDLREKLLVLPAFGVSDRMRPGFGRKRFSSSALMGATPAKTAENRLIWAYGAARNRAKPRLCTKSRHAAPQNHGAGTGNLTSVQTTTISRSGPIWCRLL